MPLQPCNAVLILGANATAIDQNSSNQTEKKSCDVLSIFARLELLVDETVSEWVLYVLYPSSEHLIPEAVSANANRQMRLTVAFRFLVSDVPRRKQVSLISVAFLP